ncbi:hypothetical protein [Massilia sp. DWR3-1-1]|uniref:hypothetical protein n=1 Tax=Massilia sp. DWR3-1-1 TaxID=2804559 RepID=UPI003CF454B2
MKKSTVAVLLSLLVFPGAGHVYLKRRLRGLAFLLPALLAAAYVVNQAVDEANKIVAQVLAGSGALDPAALAAQIEQSSGNTTLANLASAVMIVCWLGSALDAWLLATPKT